MTLEDRSDILQKQLETRIRACDGKLTHPAVIEKSKELDKIIFLRMKEINNIK